MDFVILASLFRIDPISVPEDSYHLSLLHSISDCNTLMHADNVKLLYTFDDDHGQAVLLHNIDFFVTWCRTNLMDLNLRKRKCMVLSRKDVIFPCV